MTARKPPVLPADAPARVSLVHKVLRAVRDPGRYTRRRRNRFGEHEAHELWQTRALMTVVAGAIRAAVVERRTALWWPTEKAYRYLEAIEQTEGRQDDGPQ